MALPKQVQKQANDVAEFDRQVAEQQQATEQEPASPEPTAEPQPVASPEPTPSAVPTAAPVEPTASDGQWEQKYRTLQGMFARETQTLRQQLQSVSEQLAAVKLQTTERTADQPPEKPPALVTEKDVEAFGSDLVDMARRVAREEFGTREEAYINRIAALEQQLGSKLGEVQQSQQQSNRESFFTKLGQAVPNWEAVQNSDLCQQWLGSRVPGAGFTWNDVLVSAAEKHDAPRAIEVFTTFMEAHRPAAPATPPQPATNARSRSELSRQVAPPKSSSASTTPSGEKRIYTSAEYAAESNQLIRLAKMGKTEDAARIEQELNAALMEGRIRP